MSTFSAAVQRNEEKTKENGKMSAFAAYLKEREGVDLIETEWGFAIYAITGAECYIRDIFVYPEYRKHGLASEIADKISAIAREAGCKLLTGSVAPGANNATISLDVLRGYGMKLHSISGNIIFFSKDL